MGAEQGSGGQRAATTAVLDAVRPFLGGPHEDGDGWAFEFGEHLQSNWGDVYGGALAAGSLAVGRMAAPDQSPRALHIQMVRTMPSGPAYAIAEVRHAGRTVGTVQVELFDHRRKLAAVALLTMVTPEAVAATHHDTTATPPIEVREAPLVEGSDGPVWTDAPIVLALQLGHWPDGAVAAGALEAVNYRRSVDDTFAGGSYCTLPWDDLRHTGPEAACLLADSLVAYPVMRSWLPLEAIGPNPDLTLRFTTAPATPIITGATSLLSVQHGTSTVGFEVQAGDQQLAHGFATSLLLDRG